MLAPVKRTVENPPVSPFLNETTKTVKTEYSKDEKRRFAQYGGESGKVWWNESDEVRESVSKMNPEQIFFLGWATARENDFLKGGAKMIMGMALMDGKVVVVAKAIAEVDHGKPFYLCSTMTGKQAFHPAENLEEVKEWMKKEGAESIVEGVEIA